MPNAHTRTHSEQHIALRQTARSTCTALFCARMQCLRFSRFIKIQNDVSNRYLRLEPSQRPIWTKYKMSAMTQKSDMHVPLLFAACFEKKQQKNSNNKKSNKNRCFATTPDLWDLLELHTLSRSMQKTSMLVCRMYFTPACVLAYSPPVGCIVWFQFAFVRFEFARMQKPL